MAAGAALAVSTGGLFASAASVPTRQVTTAGVVKTFETGLEGMTPWYGAAVSRVARPAPHGGRYSLRVHPRDTSWGVEEAWPGAATVHSGRTYRFGVWARAGGGATSVRMDVVWIRSGSDQVRVDSLAATTLTRTWTEKARRVTAPPGATSVAFRFAGTGRGASQFDDMSVRPAAPAPAPTTTPPPAAGCADPAFVTSDSDDGWDDGDYYVHNNMWNADGYHVSQRLAACSYRNWYVTATADDDRGDGAVKTYPNVHKDYHDWDTGKEPPLDSYRKLTSTFAATGPRVGVYDLAYDIWLNGVPGNREIMIWTDNRGQAPAGSRVASGLSFAGRAWDLYATDDNEYLAFVPRRAMARGTLDLRAFLSYLVGKGRVPARSTLGQICFGVEIVSTGGRPATFRVTDFSITDR